MAASALSTKSPLFGHETLVGSVTSAIAIMRAAQEEQMMADLAHLPSAMRTASSTA